MSAIGLLIAAWIVPGAHINGFGAALLVAAVIAALNAWLVVQAFTEWMR